MKPLFVVNPKSGGGATERMWDSMRSTIERALGPIDFEMTKHSGHGADLARDGAKAGHELVVAVGGDGTFHEVVNGLMEAKADGKTETRVGLIGQGTGGDFRKTLGIEHRLDKYVDALSSGKERPLDVGRFSGGGKTDHYFVNILSAGMGGLVDRYVADAPKVLGGKAAYFGASLKALVVARLGNVKCKVTLNGETEERSTRSYMIAVCNGRYFGGGMKVAPQAEIDDGMFDVVALGATSKLGFALTSSSIYSGDHIGRHGTLHFRANRIEMDLANDDARDVFLLDVDGEPMGGLPLTVEAVPKALLLRA
jgi:YegS/Rv2252/BmrU family lipid kinase